MSGLNVYSMLPNQSRAELKVVLDWLTHELGGNAPSVLCEHIARIHLACRIMAGDVSAVGMTKDEAFSLLCLILPPHMARIYQPEHSAAPKRVRKTRTAA